MARTKEPEVYVARSTGVVKVKGKLYRYIAGVTKVPRGHPLLDVMPGKFAPLALDYGAAE